MHPLAGVGQGDLSWAEASVTSGRLAARQAPQDVLEDAAVAEVVEEIILTNMVKRHLY